MTVPTEYYQVHILVTLFYTVAPWKMFFYNKSFRKAAYDRKQTKPDAISTQQ